MPHPMQTFLPYPDFRASAAALDDRRLGKQRVETLQILRALTWARYGWRNHPATRMWRGFVPALVAYGIAVCDEWVARGRADAVRESLLTFTGREVDQEALARRGELPPWVGNPALHRSHRSALLRKEPELYREQFPDVSDDLPYVWPGEPFPRWPVRRPSPEPMSVDAAPEVADVPADARMALDAVLAGQDAQLAAPREVVQATGALASLCTPGTTAWVRPGPALDLRHPPPPPAASLLPGAKVATSIARDPSEADLEAMAAERDARVEVRFFPDGALPTADLSDVGIVVLLDGAAGDLPARVPVLRMRTVGDQSAG